MSITKETAEQIWLTHREMDAARQLRQRLYQESQRAENKTSEQRLEIRLLEELHEELCAKLRRLNNLARLELREIEEILVACDKEPPKCS